MKRLGAGILFCVLTFAAVNLATPHVSAEKFNPENKIYVKGRVLPAHYVVVDSSGTITEITSNTTEDTVPKVYTGKISKETEIPLTEEVHKQFKRLVPSGTSKPGVLYKRTSPPLMEPAVSMMSMLLKF